MYINKNEVSNVGVDYTNHSFFHSNNFRYLRSFRKEGFMKYILTLSAFWIIGCASLHESCNDLLNDGLVDECEEIK